MGSLLYLPAGYGEPDMILSENQASEQQMFETRKILPERKKELSNLSESSTLSLKGEVGIGLIHRFFPLLAEFQTPVIMKNKKMKWLIQAGGGLSIMENEKNSLFLIDTGFRYNFMKSLNASLIGRSFLTGDFVFLKSALSIGWKPHDKIHIELNINVPVALISFSDKSMVFFGFSDYPISGLLITPSLSFSIPLKKW